MASSCQGQNESREPGADTVVFRGLGIPSVHSQPLSPAVPHPTMARLLDWLDPGSLSCPLLLGLCGYLQKGGPHGLAAGVHKLRDVGHGEASGGDSIQNLHLDGSWRGGVVVSGLGSPKVLPWPLLLLATPIPSWPCLSQR